MLLRLPLALGLTIYLVAMVMTTYDGPLSLLFQPIVGSILTALALLAAMRELRDGKIVRQANVRAWHE